MFIAQQSVQDCDLYLTLFRVFGIFGVEFAIFPSLNLEMKYWIGVCPKSIKNVL